MPRSRRTKTPAPPNADPAADLAFRREQLLEALTDGLVRLLIKQRMEAAAGGA
jgi:hypothetical protein